MEESEKSSWIRGHLNLVLKHEDELIPGTEEGKSSPEKTYEQRHRGAKVPI